MMTQKQLLLLMILNSCSIRPLLKMIRSHMLSTIVSPKHRKNMIQGLKNKKSQKKKMREFRMKSMKFKTL